MLKNFLYFLIIFISLIIIANCKKDEVIGTTNTNDSISLRINKFIFNGLRKYYFWTDTITYFKNTDNIYYNSLNMSLYSHSNHNEVFKDLLFKNYDKWSWIVDDYSQLESQLLGMAKSMGFEFGLVKTSQSNNNLLGYVRYVIKNSPADNAGIARGNMFIEVNGEQLTTSNYIRLLSQDTYLLTLAKVDNLGISPTGKTVTVSAADFQVNPIFIDTVYNINNKKVGYLLYNGFKPNYDIALNDVFVKFKNKQISDLILDLRYNPGGSILSAIYLASMIYKTDNNLVFAKNEYNKKYQAELLAKYGDGYFYSHFTDRIFKTDHNPEVQINSLNLNRLYVLSSYSTASASELIINCLRPYIPVTLIGQVTVGKNVGSITIYDLDENGVYDANIKAKVNANHKWAMQPIVMKLYNSLNQSNYSNGFFPDLQISEIDYLETGLKPLGDITEPLLSAALNKIKNNSNKSAELRHELFKPFADSKDLQPHSKEMYVY